MARDIVVRSLGRFWSVDLARCNLSDFLAKIDTIIPAEVPRTEVTVSLEHNDYEGYCDYYLEIGHVREETDEEMTARLQEQAARRQEYEINQVMKERATLVALKAKYGE